MLLLSLWSSLVLVSRAGACGRLPPYATAVLLGFATFFIALTVFYANPFATSANPPAEGAGLDPLLLHPSMMFHPPMLYSGYTLLTIPFAFAVGALITGRLGAEWICRHPPLRARRMAVPRDRDPARGPLVLHRARLGRLLGLGRGRERGADAVAVRHRVHPLDHDPGEAGMLKVWNASLVLASGTLAILGTFLVRSGILDSIHAFGASTLGVPFVLLSR